MTLAKHKKKSSLIGFLIVLQLTSYSLFVCLATEINWAIKLASSQLNFLTSPLASQLLGRIAFKSINFFPSYGPVQLHSPFPQPWILLQFLQSLFQEKVKLWSRINENISEGLLKILIVINESTPVRP